MSVYIFSLDVSEGQTGGMPNSYANELFRYLHRRRQWMRSLVCLFLIGCSASPQAPPPATTTVDSELYFYAPPGSTYQMVITSSGQYAGQGFFFIEVPNATAHKPPDTPASHTSAYVCTIHDMNTGETFEADLEINMGANNGPIWNLVDPIEPWTPNELTWIH